MPIDLPDPDPRAFPAPNDLSQARSTALIGQASAACDAILFFDLHFVLIAERIDDQSGLGAGVIGVTLLAAATSLPELTTSIAAVPIGAFSMAISNIFGSNPIMLVLVFPADVLFRAGLILQDTSRTMSLALGFGLVVTTIYLIGLIVRRKPRFGSLG